VSQAHQNQAQQALLRPGATIMGIVNTTPDSFSDGGQYATHENAFVHAMDLLKQGADIIDIGGESTRPGADLVDTQTELDRVIPVIERLAQETDAAISIDTYKPAVMSAALAAGASMVNDVNALQAEGATEIVAEAKVPVCLMHMLNKPKTMQKAPLYNDVVSDVTKFLGERIAICKDVGISPTLIYVDPGIGFGKTLDHNLALLNALPEFKSTLGSEVLIGVSRKSMIDSLLQRPVSERLAASLGLAVQAVLNGAKIVRVHDVRATFDAIRSVEAVRCSNNN